MQGISYDPTDPGSVDAVYANMTERVARLTGEEIAEHFWSAAGASRRVAALLLALTLLIVAVPYLGFVLAGAIGLPVMFRIIAPEAPWWKAVLVGLVAAALVHLLFAVGLGTPLPRGPLGI